MGGRHPLGKLVYIVLVTLFVACWLGKQAAERDGSWITTKVEWLLSGGVVVLILQLVRWPTGVLEFLSPPPAGTASAMAGATRLGDELHAVGASLADSICYVAGLGSFRCPRNAFRDVGPATSDL